MSTNPADKYAKKTFGQIESQLSRMYREAYKDVSKKMVDFTRRHNAKDKQMQRDLKKGNITQEQYASWLRGQVFIGQQWQNTKEAINLSIKNVMVSAANLIHSKAIDVFVDNANYTAFQIERDHGFSGGINFSIYDRKTVSNLALTDPELLPRKRDIDGNKLEAWNTKTIANCVSQSIIQGESIKQLSDRIARDTCTKAGRSSMLYARTAMTSAQNAGRLERMKETEDMGVRIQKQWIATLDNRTRDSHEEIDGETIDVNELFSNGLEYPGDPAGDDSEVYNCRCTMTYYYPKYSDDSKMERTAYYEEGDPEYDPDHRNYEVVKGMNYEQWTNYKQDQIRQRYNGEAKAPVSEVKPNTNERISVSSDAELEAMRQKQKEYDDSIQALRQESANLYHEKYALDSELKELRRMEGMLDNPDLQMLDHLKSEEELKEYRKQLDKEIEELYNARAAIKVPREEDYATEAEYEAAWAKYRQDKEDINGLLQDLHSEIRTAYDYRWSDIEYYREAKAIGREGLHEKQEELEHKKDELDRKIKENDEKANKLIVEKNAYNEVKLIDRMKDRNVEYREPTRVSGGVERTTEEIVSRLAGGDMTSGSCASVGLCYIGQKDGWDVLDFRGGESMSFFAGGTTNLQFMQGVAQDIGKPLLRETTNTWTGGAVKLARQMVPDREYYFVTARHAAIMRIHDGYVEYMELQSSWKNGWKPMAPVEDRAGLDRGFHNRFGASKSISGDAYMLDIEDMKNSKLLHRAYGYMNTAEDQQKKGASGHER